jgi:hypothetical protein
MFRPCCHHAHPEKCTISIVPAELTLTKMSLVKGRDVMLMGFSKVPTSGASGGDGGDSGGLGGGRGGGGGLQDTHRTATMNATIRKMLIEEALT